MAHEQLAGFLVAKYGTAASPTGLPRSWPTQPAGLDPSMLLALLGLLVFIAILALLYKEWQRSEEFKQQTYRSIYG